MCVALNKAIILPSAESSQDIAEGALTSVVSQTNLLMYHLMYFQSMVR